MRLKELPCMVVPASRPIFRVPGFRFQVPNPHLGFLENSGVRAIWHGLCSILVMGRPLRVIQTQYPYHLVCRTNNRTFRFNQRQATRIAFKAITQAAEKYKVRVHHALLMTNHYHVIATATEENIHRFMQYVNSRIAFRYNRTVGRTGHLWGDRYKSCIIDTDNYYLACVRYIYRNPLTYTLLLPTASSSLFSIAIVLGLLGAVAPRVYIIFKPNGSK